MPEIDYSAIPQPSTSAAQQDWEPPIHKFFGKKLPNGRMEPEPVYRFQPFPAFRYAQIDGKIQARMVTDEAQVRALGPEWKDSPAEFGFIGAPTYEDALRLRAEADKPKRGRPPKEE